MHLKEFPLVNCLILKKIVESRAQSVVIKRLIS